MTPTTPTTVPAANANDNSARVRRTYTAQEKSELLALFAESGMSAAEFCREMQVNSTTFALWRRQSENGATAGPGEFAEVQVSATPTPAPALTATALNAVIITTPSGATLSVPAGTDPVWVGQLVQSLR